MRCASVLVLALTSACAGTMDSVHTVRGQAPEWRNCEVAVTESGTGRVVQKAGVIGNFSVEYTVGGLFPPTMDIAAYCDGTKVKELKAVAPRRAEEVDLGTLAP